MRDRNRPDPTPTSTTQRNQTINTTMQKPAISKFPCVRIFCYNDEDGTADPDFKRKDKFPGVSIATRGGYITGEFFRMYNKTLETCSFVVGIDVFAQRVWQAFKRKYTGLGRISSTDDVIYQDWRGDNDPFYFYHPVDNIQLSDEERKDISESVIQKKYYNYEHFEAGAEEDEVVTKEGFIDFLMDGEAGCDDEDAKQKLQHVLEKLREVREKNPSLNFGRIQR